MAPAAGCAARRDERNRLRRLLGALGLCAWVAIGSVREGIAAPIAATGSFQKPLIQLDLNAPQGVPTSQLDPNVGALRITNDFYAWIKAQILQILTQTVNGQPYFLNWLNVQIRKALTAGSPDAVVSDAPTTYAYISGYLPKVQDFPVPLPGLLIGGLSNPNARLAYTIDNPPISPFPADGLLFRYSTAPGDITINIVPELTVSGPLAEVPPLCHTSDDFLEADVSFNNASLDVVFRAPNGLQDTCGPTRGSSSCLHTCTYDFSQMTCTRPAEIVYSPYDPATDSSNYVNGVALAWIPQLSLRLGVRILLENHDNTVPNSVVLGLDVQEVYLNAMADFVANPVTDSAVYQLGEYSCAATSPCPWWDVSQWFPQILPFIDAELTADAVNNLKNVVCRPDGTTCDFYFGPTPLLNLSGLGTFAHPLTPKPQNLIALDFGAQSRFWSDSVGTYIPMDLGLAINYYLADAVTPVPSCVVEPQPSPLPGVLAPIYSTPSSPWFPSCSTGPESLFNSGTQAIYPLGATLTPPGSVPPGATTYFVGLTVHENALTKALYKGIVAGIGCLWIDGTLAPVAGINLGSILNTSTFKLFITGIFDSFPNAPMAIQVQTLLADPRDGSTGPQDEPRIISGCTYDPILQPWCPAFPFPGPPTLAAPTAEVTVVLPHNAVNFFVQDNRVDPPQWLRVFGLDLGVGASFALNVLRPVAGDPCYTYSDWACDNAQGNCKCYCAGCPGANLKAVSPSCIAGCPSDCGDGVANGNTPRARRVVLTFAAAPTIQEFLEFFEAFPNKTHWDLQRLFGNLIGILLGGLQTQIQLPLCLDLSALLRANVGFDIPYIGPDGPDWDLNNFGDYLSLYLKLNGMFTARNVVGLLEASGGLSSLTGGGAAGAGLGGLGSLGSFLGTGSPPEVAAAAEPPSPAPRTFMTGIQRTGPREWTADFQATEPGRPGAKFLYAWSLDGSLWHHFQPEPKIAMGGLWEGNHVVSVMALDDERRLEPVPVEMPFRVDTLPPDVEVLSLNERNPGAEAIAGPEVRVSIRTKDAQAPPEALKVAWRLDDRSWTEWSPYLQARSFELDGVGEGRHTLEVRAQDDVGNVNQASVSFRIRGAKAWGCSSAPSASGSWILWWLPLAWVGLRKRIRRVRP